MKLPLSVRQYAAIVVCHTGTHYVQLLLKVCSLQNEDVFEKFDNARERLNNKYFMFVMHTAGTDATNFLSITQEFAPANSKQQSSPCESTVAIKSDIKKTFEIEKESVY